MVRSSMSEWRQRTSFFNAKFVWRCENEWSHGTHRHLLRERPPFVTRDRHLLPQGRHLLHGWPSFVTTWPTIVTRPPTFVTRDRLLLHGEGKREISVTFYWSPIHRKTLPQEKKNAPRLCFIFSPPPPTPKTRICYIRVLLISSINRFSNLPFDRPAHIRIIDGTWKNSFKVVAP